MQKTKTSQLRIYLKWVLWIVVIQFVLGNICAAVYAYKFTHFYKNPEEWNIAYSKNIFDKTWKLFKGPEFGKNEKENPPPFPFEKIKLALAEGKVVDTWYGTVPNAKGTVCLFHPLTLNKAYYSSEAEEFRNYGFNVLMLDFRGHGKSEGAKTTIGYKEAEEVKLAYDYILQKGEKNIFLFGGSMGAVSISRAVAVYHLSPAGIILEMPFDGLLDHIKARGRSFGFPQNLFAIPVTCWIGIENSIPVFKHRTSNYVKDIHCPVLLQWGTLDYLVTEKETETIFNSISSAKKKLVIYENAGHYSLLQQDPLKWRKEVEEFLYAKN